MGKITVGTIVLTIVVFVAGCPSSERGEVERPVTQAAQPLEAWERPGTELGQEIVGPDGAVMVWVPAGSFLMGSTDEQVAELLRLSSEDFGDSFDFWFNTETPQRQVEMDGFWIQKHAVTNARYRAFCEATGRQFPEHSEQGDDHPVVWVNWHEAVAYAEHYGLGLPTEAQWEYAARGSDGRMYPWGDEWDPQRLCWRENLGPGGTTFPVGSFPAGASWCGALDMAGNTLEWCADWYDPDYYKTAPSSNPTGPAEGVGYEVPEFGRREPSRVLRSGEWSYDDGVTLRCACRNDNYPDGRSGSSGFRCAMSIR